jgi:hypothetical protein
MTTGTCESTINWITGVLGDAESVLNWMKSIDYFGWLNTYINEIEPVINELKSDLEVIEANDCAEVDTIISWVETIVGWLAFLSSL